MTYELRLLGRFELFSPDGSALKLTSKKAQSLLAILALADGAPVSREQLLGILWADRGQEQARSSLRQALSAIRKAFNGTGEAPLQVDDLQVKLDVEKIASDISQARGNGAQEGIRGLNDKLELFRGDFLQGLQARDTAFEDWLEAQRRSFHSRKLELLQQLAKTHEAGGNAEQAIAAARQSLDCDNLNEPAHRMLMRLYANADDRVAAVKQYQVCCDALHSGLDIAPDIKTTQLYEEIRGDGIAATPSAADTNGLAALESGKPSIAVLPFKNLSDDAGEGHFADGLTEDITTELSRFHDLFVIATHSAFSYRGKDVSVVEISRELGARYILEGSTQRSGDRVRISVQLIDGSTGRHLWTERYDRLSGDIFELRDEVTGTIVATLASTYGGRLRKAWQDRPRTAIVANERAFDLFTRAVDALDGFTPQDNQHGRELLQQAIELEPKYAKAYGKLAWTHILDAVEGWTDDPVAALDRGRDCALKGIDCDDSEAWAHWPLGAYHVFVGNHDVGMAKIEKAAEFNPNDADLLTDHGMFLSYCGHAEEGLTILKKAMRLNPHYPEWYTAQSIQVLFDARRYEDAVAAHERLNYFNTTLGKVYLAASHAALGDARKAAAAVELALALDPSASVEKWTTKYLAPYKLPEDIDHFRSNLIKAGLPELSGSAKPRVVSNR